LPQLESTLAADSANVAVAIELAAGYTSEGRLFEARALLASSLDRFPGDETVLVVLGLVEEELGLFADAANRYASYLHSSTASLRPAYVARLDRRRWSALSMNTVSRLADPESPTPERDMGRVAMIPFDADPQSRELADALTWLVAAELDEGPLSVVDRLQVKAFLDATARDEPPRAGLATAIRVGRFLGAGHVMQGTVRTVEPGRVSWDLQLVTLTPLGTFGISSIPAEGGLDQLLNLAGRMVEAVRHAADGESIGDLADAGEVSSPQDLGALIALVRGELATDVDDWSGARQHFDTAVELDPSFQAAVTWRRRAAAVGLIQTQSVLSAIEEAAGVGELRRAVAALGPLPALDQGGAGATPDAQSAAMPELLGLDYVGAGAPLSLILEVGGGG
jgi:hypothetical protein